MTDFHILDMPENQRYFGDFWPKEGRFAETAIISQSNGQIIFIGQIDQELNINGLATIIDQGDMTIYRGYTKSGRKHGVGRLIKFKDIECLQGSCYDSFPAPVKYLAALDKMSYKRLMAKEMDKTRRIVEKIQRKQTDLKESFENLVSNFSVKDDQPFHTQRIRSKSQKQIVRCQDCALYYKGEFVNDMRHGFGITYLPAKQNSDFYLGHFTRDMYDGLGLYFYNTENKQSSLAFAGNFSKGLSKGHGRMIFNSGAIATGQWIQGSIQTQGAELVLPNGELWKVDIDSLMKAPENEGKKQELRDGEWVDV